MFSEFSKSLLDSNFMCPIVHAQVLDPIGLTEVKTECAAIIDALKLEPFNKVVMGKYFEPYTESCIIWRKKAHGACQTDEQA